MARSGRQLIAMLFEEQLGGVTNPARVRRLRPAVGGHVDIEEDLIGFHDPEAGALCRTLESELEVGVLRE
jgi:hypothetical protein